MTQESESDEETEAFVSIHGYGASHWRMLASEARICWARWFSLPDNVTAIRVGSQMKQHQLRRPVEIANAEPNSFIRREIDAYYATNLATRLPTNLSAYWVRYYRRLTFISSASHQSRERCMSFHEKDVFCTAEELFYKLCSIVLPTIQGKIDVFLLAYPMLPCMVDPVLGQTVYRKSDGNIVLVMYRRYFTSTLISCPTIRSQSLMSFVKMICSGAMHGTRHTIDRIFLFPLRLD